MKVRAQVALTVEVELHDSWGSDCKVDQIFKQASEAAVASVRRRLNTATKDDRGQEMPPLVCTVIAARVNTVMTTDERDK